MTATSWALLTRWPGASSGADGGRRVSAGQIAGRHKEFYIGTVEVARPSGSEKEGSPHCSVRARPCLRARNALGTESPRPRSGKNTGRP